MVTGAALAALKPDGRFQMNPPPTTAGDVSLEQARTQAPEYMKYFASQGNRTNRDLLTVAARRISFIRRYVAISPIPFLISSPDG
jgi:hypothetical protein